MRQNFLDAQITKFSRPRCFGHPNESSRDPYYCMLQLAYKFKSLLI